MRAIITDIRAGKAAALAEDGTVHLVDAKNRAVGQEIRIPAKRRRRWKKPLTWAACVAVLCGMATTGVYAAYEPYASVSIVGGTDSVEYTVNRFDQVLGTRVSGREQPPDGKIPRFVHSGCCWTTAALYCMYSCRRHASSTIWRTCGRTARR